MALKLFVTGGTGYVGGSVLHKIVTAHPEWQITALLRRVPDEFTTIYPNVQIVEGDYDSFDILSKAASEADVVIHNGNSDHEPSLNALIHGLLTHPTTSPGFLLHLSGTSIVSDWSSPTYLGITNPKVWSDISSLDEIRSLPDDAVHRNTEKILHETAEKYADRIRIAVMCPPDIYGKGRGLAKTQSVFVGMMIGEAVKLGGVDGGKDKKKAKLFYYGEGKNTRSWVHIDDLMNLYLKVAEAAARGGEEFGWNKDGYYFASTQEHTHLSVARRIAQILAQHNIIENNEPVQVSLKQIDSMANIIPGLNMLGRYLFASNSRTRSERAEALFGYKGNAPGLMEMLESDVLDAVKG